MQADLARAQSAEQGLHLQITAFNVEMKQKDAQLTELRKAKTQLEEQLTAAKAQADKVGADLKARTAQLSTVQASLAAQQAALKPATDSAQPSVPAPQVNNCLSCHLQATEWVERCTIRDQASACHAISAACCTGQPAETEQQNRLWQTRPTQQAGCAAD